MRVTLVRSSSRITLIITVAVPAIFVLGLIVLYLLHLATALGPEETQQRIRLCLLTEVSQRYMAAYKRQGLELPGNELAEQWAQEIKAINNLEFISIKVKRPIPDLFFAELPTYVVRVVFRDADQEYAPRYFWLSQGDIDREISKMAWHLSI